MFRRLCRLYKREIGFRLDSSITAKAQGANWVNLEESHFKNKKQNYEKNNLIAKNSSNQSQRKNTVIPVKQGAQKRDSWDSKSLWQKEGSKNILLSWEREKGKKIIYSQWVDNDPKQKIIQKLWGKNPDLDMIATFLAENWNLNINLRSYIIGKNGYYDYWLCQINEGYHKAIVNHPNFYNLDFQIEKCAELWKKWTKFYWKNNRMKFKKYLIFK